MKKIVTFMFALLCASGAFATVRVVLPKWFTEIPENEYVGISEPGGNENQAITMALLQYMFANHAQGDYFISSDIMHVIDGYDIIDGHDNTFCYCSIKDTIDYDILKIKRLPSGEYVCRITNGTTHHTEITILLEEYKREDIHKKQSTINNSIKGFISSSIGDWSFIVNDTIVNYEQKKCSWTSQFSDLQTKSLYNPKPYTTKYKFAKRTIDGANFEFGIGQMSPYSICDNLLVAYKNLLFGKNASLSNQAVQACYNGSVPTYFDDDPHYITKSEPIVLQTPITSISLNILNSQNVGILYEEKALRPEDTAYIKNNIEKRVQAYNLPPFSEYAKNYIEPRINEWQKKGEFEKTNDWKERVSQTNRQKKIDEYLEEAKKEYLPKYAKRQEYTFSLGTYDPDHEVYLVKEITLGDILIPVPVAEAPYIKQNWNKRTVTPHYDVIGNEVGISSIDFYFPNKKTYTYKPDVALNYAISNIQYNFKPFELAQNTPFANTGAFFTFLHSRSINSITVVTDFEAQPASSVLASYQTHFSKLVMPDKDEGEQFPYTLIRVRLKGEPNKIRLAKQMLTLNLGQMFQTEQTVNSYDNMILYLVPSDVRSIYLTCGDGCERQLIYSGRLMPNKIYDGVVEVK